MVMYTTVSTIISDLVDNNYLNHEAGTHLINRAGTISYADWLTQIEKCGFNITIFALGPNLINSSTKLKVSVLKNYTKPSTKFKSIW